MWPRARKCLLSWHKREQQIADEIEQMQTAVENRHTELPVILLIYIRFIRTNIFEFKMEFFDPINQNLLLSLFGIFLNYLGIKYPN